MICSFLPLHFINQSSYTASFFEKCTDATRHEKFDTKNIISDFFFTQTPSSNMLAKQNIRRIFQKIKAIQKGKK